MTQVRKRAVWSLAIWGPVMLLFLLVFFAGAGPEAYAHAKARHVIVAVLFALGFGSFGTMLYLTRVRPGQLPTITDERDETIARRASSFALVAVLMFVYVVSIVLWTSYEDPGVLPTGWMWFLAYATPFFGLICQAAATLVLDSRMVVHGEG